MTPPIAILGGGPAGSTAAFALARRGRAVTLIEQHRFPRDKVCGECLSALGMQTLEGLGLADRLRAAGPMVLRRATLHPHAGEALTLDLPRPMWGLTRHALDAALLGAARDAGVTLLQPVRCEKIEWTPLPELALRDLTTNALTALSPDWLLLADGKSAFLPGRPAPTGDLGVKAHFAGVDAPRDAIGLFALQGHYVGLAPVEGDLWNVAFSVPASKLAAITAGAVGHPLEVLWEHLLAENRALARAFAGARRVSQWLCSPLPRFPVRPDWPPRTIPLGNAAAALEPIGGEGMGLAVRSAALAAAALDRIVRERPGRCPAASAALPGLSRAFTRLWAPRRAACRALARALSSPAWSAPLVDLARATPPLARAAMALMGKG